MERWRWVPRELGKSHVILNIPDFTLRVIRNEQLYWTTKVVVGKPHTPTPLISASMSHITVNPTWNVPPSIVYGEYVPAMQQDPTVMQRMGFKVSQNQDGSVHIAQPPGDGNALGRIRFNFPNKFLVYQHDTNEKHYFARYPRAYSHGCMRVEDPVKYAEVLLSMVLPNEGYSQERIRRMYGPSEIDIKFPANLPVHITYQTAFVDDQGNLQIRDDIYGRDARVLASLRGEERKIADVPVDRPQPNYSRPPVTLPAGALAGGGYNPYGGGGGGFFEMLFGGGPRYQQQQPQQQQVARPARRASSRAPTVSW
jgi:murein L,D-transpeptidase YcbB/YkuD